MTTRRRINGRFSTSMPFGSAAVMIGSSPSKRRQCAPLSNEVEPEAEQAEFEKECPL